MQHGSSVALVDGSQIARQLRHSLHWLPVRARADFKSATLSYKSRMTGQPDYLAAELRSYQPQLCLRSSSQELLSVPHCKTMLDVTPILLRQPPMFTTAFYSYSTADLKTFRGLRTTLPHQVLLNVQRLNIRRHRGCRSGRRRKTRRIPITVSDFNHAQIWRAKQSSPEVTSAGGIQQLEEFCQLNVPEVSDVEHVHLDNFSAELTSSANNCDLFDHRVVLDSQNMSQPAISALSSADAVSMGGPTCSVAISSLSCSTTLSPSSGPSSLTSTFNQPTSPATAFQLPHLTAQLVPLTTSSHPRHLPQDCRTVFQVTSPSLSVHHDVDDAVNFLCTVKSYVSLFRVDSPEADHLGGDQSLNSRHNNFNSSFSNSTFSTISPASVLSVLSAPSSLAGDDQGQLPSPTYTRSSSAQPVHNSYNNFVWVPPKHKSRRFNFPTVYCRQTSGEDCV